MTFLDITERAITVDEATEDKKPPVPPARTPTSPSERGNRHRCQRHPSRGKPTTSAPGVTDRPPKMTRRSNNGCRDNRACFSAASHNPSTPSITVRKKPPPVKKLVGVVLTGTTRKLRRKSCHISSVSVQSVSSLTSVSSVPPLLKISAEIDSLPVDPALLDSGCMAEGVMNKKLLPYIAADVVAPPVQIAFADGRIGQSEPIVETTVTLRDSNNQQIRTQTLIRPPSKKIHPR